MKDTFNTSAQDQESGYFSSPAFYAMAESAIKFYIVEHESGYGVFTPRYPVITPQDEKELKKTLGRLKETYPMVDHMRLYQDRIIVDTQAPAARSQRVFTPSL